jgi:putative peptidoglycan lipid II flippase
MIACIKKFMTQSSRNSIAAGALIVAIFGIFSRILGLVRDRILASHYGAGDALDVYYAAFRLPDLVFELLVVGSLGAAFIPIFSKLIIKDDRDDAWSCAAGVLMTVIISMAFFSLIGIFFAPYLMHFIVPGFPEEKMMQAANLARVMFLSPVFLAASAVLGSVLVSFRRFVFYSMAPLFYNCGIIFGAVYLSSYFGLIGLAWGVVLGSIFHFLINFIAAAKAGFQFKGKNIFPHQNLHVRQTIRLMLPRMLTSASTQISLLLITFFASTLAAGSLTVFTFAINVQSVVLGLIGVPFALAAFPVLSNKFASGDVISFGGIFSQTLRRILYYAVPLSMIFFVLREQIIRVVYGAGHFDLEDTILTYQVLGILCLSLFAQSIIPLLARGFYAMQNTKTPFYIALVSQIITIIIIVFLIREIGIYAIAVAFSTAAIFNAFLLFYILHKKINIHECHHTLRTSLQIVIATFVAFTVTYFSRNFLGSFLPLQYVLGVFAQLSIAGSFGALTYLFVTAIFDMREYETIKKKIIIRIFGRPQVATEQQNIIR